MEDIEAVATENLDDALEEFRVEICKALLSMPLNEIKYVDIVFHKSASGVIPKFRIRRVQERSDVDSADLHNNVERVVRYHVEDIRKVRKETNNE